MKKIKLSQFAKEHSVNYRTACARIYGKRRNKSKTKKLLKELENV